MAARDMDSEHGGAARRLRAPAPQGARDAARRRALVAEIVERAVLPALIARKDRGAFACPRSPDSAEPALDSAPPTRDVG